MVIKVKITLATSNLLLKINNINHEVNKYKNEQKNKYNRNAIGKTNVLSTIKEEIQLKSIIYSE